MTACLPLRHARVACRAIAAIVLSLCAACAAAEPADWAPLDAAVRAQMAAGEVPGAVVVIGDAQQVWLRRAWGLRAVEPPEPMTADTVFDLASLTKVLCTTTAVLQLAERGRLELDAPAARYWPAFAAHGKSAITVGQLLSHSSGLRPGLSLAATDTHEDVLRKLLAESPLRPPGSSLIYSDLNFITLGMLVQRVSGMPLDRYCRRRVFQPLHMRDTTFRPPVDRIGARIAPTERRGQGWLRGTVQDPTARRLGGVSGHAGLFGSADDLARFAQALLRGGPAAPLSRESLAALQRRHSPPEDSTWHGWGWQLQAPLVAEREALAPLGALGHTGYTGTGLWIDFVNRRFVVLLTSRLQLPYGDARPLRRQVLALVSSLLPPISATAQRSHDPQFAPDLAAPPPPEPGPVVHTGIDVLRADAYAALRGHRLGLITNLSAIDRQGWRTLDRLRWAPGVTLVKVFSPEHGLYGDAEGHIADAREPLSGLPVVSLYGAQRQPPPQALADIDTLVFDLQDAGARYFTYVSTLGLAMEAAARARLRFVVLDRPDPLRADRTAGPMLDANLRSFTAYTQMPVQHGMTIGEMALLLQRELQARTGLALDLQIIAMQGYRRSMWFDQTGLDWVPPSPNLRRPNGVALYPGVAWVEGANVSVGRGTDRPFERVGAPWISGRILADALGAQALPGVSFEPIVFSPGDSTYAGQTCEGVAITVTDRDRLDATLLGAALTQTLYRLWPDRFRIELTLGMVGSASTLDALRAGADLQALQDEWRAASQDFAARRGAVLLYQ
jgi:uncharacterized protein YbbC (DUF1343 family)/CubicO group peptidase (beta-lactamase class C family)